MNTPPLVKRGFAIAVLVVLIGISAKADTFGTTGNEFTIDFVNVGNAGNAADGGAGGGLYSSPYGGVAYGFRMGVYEISKDNITRATASGLLNVTGGPWAGNQPSAGIEWYQAAAFVNFLNTSTGHQAAYDLTFNGNWTMALWSSEFAWDNNPGVGVALNLYRHKDAHYFLPSEDEWYKTAYHKNDGVTANYWDYATGSNSIPDGIDFDGDTAFEAVFVQGFASNQPNAVTNVGVASPYGTFGQNGNVYEWSESAFDGSNNSSSEFRVWRGGSWDNSENNLRPTTRGDTAPSFSNNSIGFRVASVPEPTSVVFLLFATGTLLSRRLQNRP